MKLLFATSIVPTDAPTSGYEIATRAILDGLARAGADVTVLGFAWPGTQPAGGLKTIVLGERELRTDRADLSEKLAWMARALGTGTTFSSAKLKEYPEQRLRDAIARAGPFDGVILNSVQFAGAFEDVFRDWPAIYVAHNVEHVSARQNAEALGGLRGLIFRREARLLERLEQRLCEAARYVFTLAENDRQALNLSAARAATLPLTVSRTPPAPMRREPVFDLGLIGSWTWQPNLIGLQWFLDEVVPLLPAGLDIRVAGDVPQHVSPPRRGVRFVGRVPDAATFLRQARAVPLVSRAGTGVQLKTIEVFELGLPCVTTTLSLRGIEALPASCRRADDAAEFARACVELVAAPPADLDGRAFHKAQQDALDRQIRLGLLSLAEARRLAA